MRYELRRTLLFRSDASTTPLLLAVALACILCLSACGGDDGALASGSGDTPGTTVGGGTSSSVPVDSDESEVESTSSTTATTAVELAATTGGWASERLFVDQAVDVDGSSRSYHLFVPAQAEGAPLVVLLHENGLDPDRLLGLDGEPAPFGVWLDVAEREGFAIVAPEGEGGGWNDCREDASTNPAGDDVAFIAAVIDEVAAAHGIDTARVFATGMSNGGHMSIRLAEEAPDLVAGFAAVGAADSAVSECSSSHAAIPALFMNGTADGLMPFNGGAMAGAGAMVFSTEETVARWVERNGAGEATVEILDDVEPGDGSTVTISRFAAGSGEAPVVLYTIDGGGHNEPSLTQERADLRARRLPQNRDIEMAEEVWHFFSELTS